MRVMAFLCTLGALCSGATVRVPADYPTIQEGIDAATHGDTVLVASGDYIVTEPITFRGKAITLEGEEGAQKPTIRMAETPTDPQRASVVIFVGEYSSESILEGFTLTGGRGTFFSECWYENGGGGIFCRDAAAPTVRNCVITGNKAHFGGGVYCVGPGSERRPKTGS